MFDLNRVIEGDAIGISLTGMGIVFCGLVLISLYIRILPPVLEYLTTLLGNKEADLPSLDGPEPLSESDEYDLVSVIGLVMQLEAQQQQTPQEREEKEIVSVIGLVMQLEQDRLFALPN